ncbi:LytR/AlgR family response regulator transcription factor [Bifidobacterium samirii]|uniref:DNA-binding response regulator n=1 Tax=Bifidobacterium samirii TaxID=2306974 RepID=A0A430FRA8_9BIFI|nr:response regulator transcription factor [Bifidobacterium samirii]RSX55391.1 DNA-binding response regulator [Bifidobacterium samirii]
MHPVLRCAIVDDVADHRDRLASSVASYCAARAIGCGIERFDSPAAFVAAFRAARFDVVFLDGYFDTLDSPDDARTTGMDAARWLRRHGFDVPVVFTTVSTDFAVAGYGVDAAGYLVKPFLQSELAVVLDKIVSRMPGVGAGAGGAATAGSAPPVPPSVIDLPIGAHDADLLRTRVLDAAAMAAIITPEPTDASVASVASVASGASGASVASAASSASAPTSVSDAQPVLRVDTERLAYCRADLHRVAFHDALDPARPAFSVRMSFSTLESALAGMPWFFVCARGYVVNLDCVAGLDGDAFVLSRGGVRVPVSRRRAAEARARYADHVFSMMRDDPPAAFASAAPPSAASAASAAPPSAASITSGSRP